MVVVVDVVVVVVDIVVVVVVVDVVVVVVDVVVVVVLTSSSSSLLWPSEVTKTGSPQLSKYLSNKKKLKHGKN